MFVDYLLEGNYGGSCRDWPLERGTWCFDHGGAACSDLQFERLMSYLSSLHLHDVVLTSRTVLRSDYRAIKHYCSIFAGSI